MEIWHGKFSMVVLSTKKRYSSFSKKFFVFQRTCFKVRVMKMKKLFFRGTYHLSVGFKVEPLRIRVSLC